MIINNYMMVLKPDDDRIDREIYAAIDDAVSGKFLEQKLKEAYDGND